MQMLTVTDAIVEFREILLGDRAASFEFQGPVDVADIAALEEAIDARVPDDLREMWGVSSDAEWTFSQLLHSPITAIVPSQIFNLEILDLGLAGPLRKVICFGDHIGDGICYVLEGPVQGQIVWIDPQNDGYVRLGDSLAEYFSAVVALAKAGQMKTVLVSGGQTPTERLIPKWVTGFGSYLDVPEGLQAPLGIGPTFC